MGRWAAGCGGWAAGGRRVGLTGRNCATGLVRPRARIVGKGDTGTMRGVLTSAHCGHTLSMPSHGHTLFTVPAAATSTSSSSGVETHVGKGVKKGVEKGVENRVKERVEKNVKKSVENSVKKRVENGVEKGVEKDVGQGGEECCGDGWRRVWRRVWRIAFSGPPP